jgi:hypothetical protein
MKRIEYKNHVIIIEQDENPLNPRIENDNLARMLCFHKDYRLGDGKRFDDFGFNRSDYNSWDEMEDAIIKQEKPAVILPLYLYDHSGITISTTPFSCHWDSGQVGFVWVTRKEAKELYGIKRNFFKKTLERIEEYIKAEVKEYDYYLTGNVFCYKIEDKDGNDLDSCGGFYGESYVEQEAKEIVDSLVEKKAIPVG